jgi:hypothetical protein
MKMMLDIAWYLTRTKTRTRTRTRMLRPILAIPQIVIRLVKTERVEAPDEAMIDTVVILTVVVRGEIHGKTENDTAIEDN